MVVISPVLAFGRWTWESDPSRRKQIAKPVVVEHRSATVEKELNGGPGTHVEALWSESEGMPRWSGLTRQSLELPWTR